MKKFKFIGIASALLIALPYVFAQQYSMSDADRAMYEELKENNPAELDAAYGESIFESSVGGESGLAKSLGVSEDKLYQYIASFPRYSQKAGKVIGLDQAIQIAMVENGQKPYKLSSKEMVSLYLYVKSLANGQKLTMDKDANKEMKEAYALGEKMWWAKRGARGLSCADCHELSPKGAAGMILRTQLLPIVSDESANSAGTWPAYRMEMSGLVTLQGRFKQCMNNSLQAKIPEGSAEMVALEVYVTNMNKGMTVELPGLKR